MRILLGACLGLHLLFLPAPLVAGSFDHAYEISYERSALDGLSLGSDRTEDRLVEEEFEFEFALEYRVNNDLFLFFTAALIDETETIETAGLDESVSGLERREIGVGYFFGETVDSLLVVGRSKFVSASQWWVWWDEELDAIRLQSAYRDVEMLLALAEEQAPENTDEDFIDPELEDVRRLMFSLAWEFSPAHSLNFYYLDQEDRSDKPDIGDFRDYDKVDEGDADLTWIGVSYLGELEFESIGYFTIELHVAEVTGDEIVYEFEDPENGLSELDERVELDVDGSAQGALLGWTPTVLEDLTFFIGSTRADGDPDPENGTDESFRGNGLQGDGESFGELYRPELSNINIDMVGIVWRISENIELALFGYDYEQQELAEEMRDVAIELDLTGESRDLGSEIDLILQIETSAGLEVILIASEFDAGRAYGSYSDETASYFSFEIAYEF